MKFDSMCYFLRVDVAHSPLASISHSLLSILSRNITRQTGETWVGFPDFLQLLAAGLVTAIWLLSMSLRRKCIPLIILLELCT